MLFFNDFWQVLEKAGSGSVALKRIRIRNTALSHLFLFENKRMNTE